MKINDIRIRIVNKENSKIKAIASISVEDCLVIHDIKVIETENGLILAMPSRRTQYGDYKDIVHPLNSETRELLSSVIFAAYEEAKAKE
ncbi:MAG: septation regulator SpoVG [Bacteroidales bacterium]|nr:septation regulator SpoVG [Bacteroidales bacterium]